MADACLHICLVLYSFCIKKNKNKNGWRLPTHLSRFILVLQKKKNCKITHFYTLPTHFMFFILISYTKNKLIKWKKNGWRSPYTLSVFYTRFMVQKNHKKKCVIYTFFKNGWRSPYTSTSFYTHFMVKKMSKKKIYTFFKNGWRLPTHLSHFILVLQKKK